MVIWKNLPVLKMDSKKYIELKSPGTHRYLIPVLFDFGIVKVISNRIVSWL